MSKNLIIAVIESSAIILAVLIPSVELAIAGYSLNGYRRLQRNYQTLLKDMQFMLLVEHEHCRVHKETTGV